MYGLYDCRKALKGEGFGEEVIDLRGAMLLSSGVIASSLISTTGMRPGCFHNAGKLKLSDSGHVVVGNNKSKRLYTARSTP